MLATYRYRFRLPFVAFALLLAACSSQHPTLPSNAVVAARPPSAWPTPRSAPPDAVPEIQALRFSSLDPRMGEDWNGEIVASSNTASIEVTTNLFTFSVPRPEIGRFRFAFHLIDVPPFFIRAFPLRVIARNTAGVEREVDVPFRLRGRASRE